MEVLFNVWGAIVNFFQNTWDNFYQTIIYDNRYLYILEGLFNTLIIALFVRLNNEQRKR